MITCKFELIEGLYTCLLFSQELQSDVTEENLQLFHLENYTNEDVQEISIIGSYCPKIPNGLGDIFKNVIKISIVFSHLSELSKESLKQFKNLEIFESFKDELKKLPKDLFEFNKKLKKININKSKLQKIESGLLDDLQDLEEIHIKCCELEHIPSDLFKFNKNLKEICFSENKIQSIEPELLKDLNELIYIDFEDNPGVDFVWSKNSKVIEIGHVYERSLSCP